MMPSIVRGTRTVSVAAGLLVLLLAAAGAAQPAGPAVGTWATYRWTSSIRQDVAVLVRQAGPGGQVSWSVARESAAPAPVFVTYGIVQGDARSYTLQIVTHETLDGPPLSVTQVRVDRASGKALRSVIQAPKGPIATPESGLRPFRQGDVKGNSPPNRRLPSLSRASTMCEPMNPAPPVTSIVMAFNPGSKTHTRS